MTAGDEETLALLERWYRGDRTALGALIDRDRGWIEAHVRKRLGPMLRARAETQDYVQDAMIEVLEFGPKFVPESHSRFRSLVARIIENMLRDKNDWYRAKRRAGSRERPIPNDSVLGLDRPIDSVTRPSKNAEQGEGASLLRIALEFLDPIDRKVILLRQWEEKEFAAIGTELGMSADSVRMRFNRALPRLALRVAELRSGKLPETEGDEPDDPA